MARKGGKDRGLVEKPKGSGKWYVRLCAVGQDKLFRCDSKSQAKALYGRLRADIREKKYFPEQFAAKHDVTLAAWIRCCLDGCSNRGLVNDRRHARRWSLWFGTRLLAQLSIEELRRHQVKLRSKMKLNTKTKQPKRLWSDATINRHYAFLRHILMLAMDDGKLTMNPVSSITFFQEEQRTRFLTDGELRQLEQIMVPHD